jgi:drug/metabolite transporter (DMT)-like permease
MRPSTFFWILVAQAIGGSTPALTKLALAGFGPWSLVVIRQLLGLVFLTLFIRVSAGHLRPQIRETFAAFDRRDWLLVILLSWAGFALPQILGALGLQLSTATNGALLSPLEPIGILIGGAFLLGERLRAARVLALVLGLSGATLIVSQGGIDPRAGNLRGDAIMALGHLAWAIYTLAAKALVDRHDPSRVAFLAVALSPWPLIPLALSEPALDPAVALPALGWIGLLAFLATAVATYAWNRALREVSAGTMAVFIFLQPLWGLLLGRLLGEPVGLLALVGAALIVAGTTVGALRDGR